LQDMMRPRVPGAPRKPKVLHVVHSWDKLGGVEVYLRRLVDYIADDVESTVLAPVTRPFFTDGSVWLDDGGTMHIRMMQCLCDAPLWAHDFPLSVRDENAERYFAAVLEGLRPDVVHVHHLGGYGTAWLTVLAKQAGCKVVVTLHDEYLLCPILKDGGKCSRTECNAHLECYSCLRSRVEARTACPAGAEVVRYLIGRDSAQAPADCLIDAMLSPSKWLADRHLLGAHVLPHGVPGHPIVPVRKWRAQGKLRVAWVGGATNKKGWEDFAQVARDLAEDVRIEFSVIGAVSHDCSRQGLAHVKFVGAYAPAGLPQLLQQVDVAVPAVLPHEAYGMVADECVASGCVVLARHAPALAERYPVGLRMYHAVLGLREMVQACAAYTEDAPALEVLQPAGARQQAMKVLDVYKELICPKV
jgi:glycosyltransferase involved in cell wall biosynthesis